MRTAWIAVILANVVASTASAQTYVMVDLDPTSAFKSFTVTRITEANSLVGVAETLPPSTKFGVSIDAGGAHFLPMLPGDASLAARGRNASGDVVGIGMKVNPPDTHPVMWHLGQPADVNSLVTGGVPMTLETAESIDSFGAIVGSGTDTGGFVRAYRLSQGIVSDLGCPFGPTGWANALRGDDFGRIVGMSGPGPGVEHATLWASPQSAPVDVHDPTIVLGTNSRAVEADRWGRACGWAEYAAPPSTVRTATLWVGGVPQSLGSLPGKSSDARGMNDLSTVVGYSFPTGTDDVPSSTALIWRNGQLRTLDSITQLPLGWTIKRAYDINNKGVIAAEAAFVSGVVHPVLLVPYCPNAFTNFGTGCQGTTVTPLLTAQNCPSPGNAFALQLSSALPNSFALLCTGTGTILLRVVPSCSLEIAPIFNLVVALMTDSTGAAFIPIDVPPGVPVVDVNFQVLVADPGAHGNVAETPALKVHVQ